MIERDERLRKLEPKLGEMTTRALWLGSLDPRLRRHVDPFIGALSDRLLEESYKHEKVLLPPPDPAKAAGPIAAGQVWYDGPRSQLGLHTKELVKHVGIIGSSGSGKTTFGLRLARSLLDNDIPCIIFDVKRIWRTLAEYVPDNRVKIFTLSRPGISPFFHNFLIPPDGIPDQLFDQISTTIGDEVLYGGLGSRSIVTAATDRLRKQYPMPGSEQDHFTMAELSREVQRVAGEMKMQKRSSDWSATAQRITAELSSPPLGNIINVRRNLMEKELERCRLAIFEMDLFSHYQYTYFITSFLVREYLKRLNTENPDELELMIIFEEAGRIFNQPFPQPQFETMLREVREKGLGIMWLNQSASDVNRTAWANTNTLFAFKQISRDDINRVGSAIAFERPREKEYLARLGVGEAIVRLPDRHRFPFLIRTKDMRKISVGDQRIKDLAEDWLAEIGAPLPGPAMIDEVCGPESRFSGDKIVGVPNEAVASAPGSQGLPTSQVSYRWSEALGGRRILMPIVTI